MADFAAEDLLEDAQERFGAATLRAHMPQGLTDQQKDDQLLNVALSVYARARVAAGASGNWPFPPPFNATWPWDFYQHALELFWWRTFAGDQEVTEHEREVGLAAEAYFAAVQGGGMGLAIGGAADLSPGAPIAARNRDGTSNIATVADIYNTIDSLSGPGWDWSGGGWGHA